MLKDLNEYAKKIHVANRKWWVDLNTGAPLDRNKAELLMLVVTELSECLEGERKNLQDDKLPHRKMAEVEMADAVIRLLDYAGGFGIEISEFSESDIRALCSEPSPENKGEFLLNITLLVCDGQGLPESDRIRLIIWMIEHYCDKFGYELWDAVEEKLAFNAVREDHTHEARKKANGKKF